MSDIIVKFKPKGQKELVAAINAIQAAQKNLTGSGKKYNVSVANMTAKLKAQGKTWKSLGISMRTLGKAAKGNRVAFEKLNLAMKKNIKSGRGMLRNNRLISNSFATMRSHLLLYSFAMSLGIRQIGQLVSKSSKFKNMEKSFDSLTGASESSAVGISKLRAATVGTVSDFDLLQQANNAMILGVTKNTDEMSHMFDMAKKLGDALGRDTASSVESFITGIGRQSRQMLDNIGIVVDSKKAYKDYAAANKLNASSLTDTQKKQAFLNATLAAAEAKIKKLPPKTKQASDQFAQFGATMDNVGMIIGSSISPELGDFAEGISNFINDLLQSDLEQLVTDLKSVGVASKDLKDITDLITLEKAFKIFEKNQQQFEEGFTNMGKAVMGFSGAADVGVVEKYSEAIIAMGGNAKINGDSVIATFGQMENIDTEKMFKGLKLISTSMLETARSSKDLKKENLELNMQLMTNNNLSEEAREAAQNVIAKNEEQIKQNKMIVSNNRIQIEHLLELLQLTTGYQQALDILNGTKKESNKEDGDAQKIFKAQIAELNERAIIEQQLKINKKDIQALQKEDFKTDLLKQEAEKKIVSLQKTQMTLKEKLIKLDEDEEAAVFKTSQKKLKSYSQMINGLAAVVGMSEKNAKIVAGIQATGAVVDAFAGASSARFNAQKSGLLPPIPGLVYAAELAAGLANARSVAMSANDVGSGGGGGLKYEQGGYVGGRRHSQGGTMIEAEKGEFVMSRNAVESIGLETLNQMNKGGGGGNININVSGNVLTQDFVEGELAESIKEAVRRGSDFGLS